MMQLVSKNENGKVISIAGNATSLLLSGSCFDVPSPLLSITEGRK